MFKKTLRELAPRLTEEKISQMHAYFMLVREAGREFNLTAILDEDRAAELHFYDSIVCEASVPPGAAVLDVGTGAGFPGIPLKIARPDIRLTLLDATRKKTDFIVRAAAQLGLDAQVIYARAEETAKPPLRESFDVCVSRAVAPLQMLAELCLPFVRRGGIFFAYKADFAKELQIAKRAIHVLGGAYREAIAGSAGNRHAVLLIEKIQVTPAKYPRRFARIAQKPL